MSLGKILRTLLLCCAMVAVGRAQELIPAPPPAGSPPVAPPAAIPAVPPPAEPVMGGPVVEAPSVTGDVPSFWMPGEPLPSDGMPDWYNPLTWFSPTFWDGSFEVGINGTEGNANAFSLRTGFELSRETDRTNWDVDFTYGKNQSNGAETQHNALLGSNWDYKLSNPRLSWFNKLGLEYDEFKNFDIRLFGNTGLGYLFIDNDTTELRGRFGAGSSREFGGVDDKWKPEAVFGADFAHQFTPRQKMSIVVDYYPTWEDFTDYRIVTDAGWEVVLDEASNLSFKLGVIDRYDSTPNGAKRNDVDYSVLLLWKL